MTNQQQFFSELHSPGRSHYTNYWYSRVQTIYYFTRAFQPIPSWLNWPITFNGPDFPTDQYYSLDAKDDFPSRCPNVSHQQQLLSEPPSPGRSHYTNYWYSRVQTIYHNPWEVVIPRIQRSVHVKCNISKNSQVPFQECLSLTLVTPYTFLLNKVKKKPKMKVYLLYSNWVTNIPVILQN